MKMKSLFLALIETVSYCCGVHNNRYSVEQDWRQFENETSAPEKITAP